MIRKKLRILCCCCCCRAFKALPDDDDDLDKEATILQATRKLDSNSQTAAFNVVIIPRCIKGCFHVVHFKQNTQNSL